LYCRHRDLHSFPTRRSSDLDGRFPVGVLCRRKPVDHSTGNIEMNILGISAHYHDSAAALVIDGVPVCAVQEERLSRHKGDAAFPLLAIEWCLQNAVIEPDELDAVVFYERPMLKFDRV